MNIIPSIWKTTKVNSEKQFKNSYINDIKKNVHFNDEYNDVISMIDPEFKIISWDINMWKTVSGKNNCKKIIKLTNFYNPDIVMFQNVLRNKNLYKFIKKTKLKPIVSNENITFYYNKSNLSCYNIIFVNSKININNTGSFIFGSNAVSYRRGWCMANLYIDDPKMNITFANVYLDNTEPYDTIRLNQFKEIEKIISNYYRVVISGDFNSLKRSDYTNEEWSWLCNNNFNSFSIDTKLIKYIEEKKYIDIFITSRKISTWNARRLDYTFITSNLKVINPSFWFINASNHLPLLFAIQIL